MAKEGIPFLIVFLVPAALSFALGIWILGVVFVAFAMFMAFFFRDPDRRSPGDPSLIISPADGRVLVVAPVDPEQEPSAIQVSIFLSPLDVHINRSPIAGEIVDVTYRRGAFHIASREIASVENEQNIVTVKGQFVTLVFRQIAGILARRLVFWRRIGDVVGQGERIGLMKFGSRMDVIVPPEVEVLVRPGDRVKGGVTAIGRLRSASQG
ncbi:MAG TPA: phosphatidylserine decarboxylase [Blastocatellia bacterium]|nr:phosphatidylserine decarboxylase [Blastocatellia bacterium]